MSWLRSLQSVGGERGNVKDPETEKGKQRKIEDIANQKDNCVAMTTTNADNGASPMLEDTPILEEEVSGHSDRNKREVWWAASDPPDRAPDPPSRAPGTPLESVVSLGGWSQIRLQTCLRV